MRAYHRHHALHASHHALRLDHYMYLAEHVGDDLRGDDGLELVRVLLRVAARARLDC